jgi:hypothetical protein
MADCRVVRRPGESGVVHDLPDGVLSAGHRTVGIGGLI